MTPSAPAPRAQTLKQAKAAYKTRNQPTLTDREKKQLARSVELDRRAWKAQEAEKRRAEVKVKRDEKERKDREGGMGMTSQRRTDRFGFIGSQMHLGAFFGGGRRAAGMVELVAEGTDMAGDECFDSDLDDESILDVVENDQKTFTQPKTYAGERESGYTRSKKNEPPSQLDRTEPAVSSDLDLFWDDMDSSTQIARDLAIEPPVNAVAIPASPNHSFSSGEFDLSVEDIEEAQAIDRAQARVELDKKLMPPPALPVKKLPKTTTSFVSKQSKTALQRVQLHQIRATVQRPNPSDPVALRTTDCACKPAPHLDFTMAELESFIDDDLQLTQVDPV